MSEKSKGPKRSKNEWSGAEKLRIVVEASALTGSELGALLRREGGDEDDITEGRSGR